jgi:tetratricopeptide (TPR) repeat protein
LLDYAAGRYEVAAGEFERAVAGDQAADARFNRGVCLDRLGRYAGAADEYAAAVAARPDFAEAWLQLGHDCRLRLGQPDRARDAYRSYLDLGGDDPEVRRYLASEER